MTQHIPVLLQETIHILNPKPGHVVFDGTFGGGGHATAFANRIAPNGVFVGVDRDEERIHIGQSFINSVAATDVRAELYTGSYAHVEHFLLESKVPRADILFLDLGFSSFQIEDPLRGFSFQQDGPLDMRYDRTEGVTAAEVINTFAEEALADIIYKYGEEPKARIIAKKICEVRKKHRIYGTHEFADLVSFAKRERRGKIHPATKTFQALRIYVNDELGNLKLFLLKIPACISKGGRVGIITFHGLEDKLVKNIFQDFAKEKSGVLLTKKPISPSSHELSINPRARSAKLRVISFV